MAAKITTMKALVEAIQDEAGTEEETVAALTHLLSRRGLVLAGHPRGAAQVARSFF